MELADAMLTRRSVRKFTDKKVERETVTKILHAAMSGPSACNRTPWEFYVVTDADTMKELRKASKFSNIQAPLAIIVAGNLKRALPMQMASYWVQDCSAATENILLSAVDNSLGAVWCGIYPQERAEEKVRHILSLPDSEIPLNIIFLGYPAEKTEPRDQYDEKYIHFVE